MFALVKVFSAEWINGDVHVTATAKGVGFADKTVVIQGDAVGVLGADFTGGQHRFHLADKVRECFIQLPTFGVTECTGDTGPVSQIMQPVPLLHQTNSQARRDIPLQTPCDVGHGDSPLYCQFRVMLIKQV